MFPKNLLFFRFHIQKTTQLLYVMLYETEGGRRGRKLKYMVLQRGGRVQFDF